MTKEMKCWEGKRVFVKLKSGGIYNGIVLEITEAAGLYWFLINDKFDKKIMFVNTEIESIEEKG